MKIKKKKEREGKKKKHSCRTGPAHSPKTLTGYAARPYPRRPRAAYRISANIRVQDSAELSHGPGLELSGLGRLF
jgi:hypothetical protein